MRYIFTISIAILTSIALNAQSSWNYISPKPGSKMINQENNIAIRNGERLNLNTINNEIISVSGSQSGIIYGDLKLSVDHKTLIFNPTTKYKNNEKINVTLQPGISTESGRVLDGLSFSFSVKPIDIRTHSMIGKESYQSNPPKEPSINNTKEKEILFSYKNLFTYGDATLPDNFPQPVILAYDNPAPELAFYATEPTNNQYGTYAVIVDNYGTPVFYREWPSKTVNFQVVANNQLIHKHKDANHVDPNSFLVLDDKYNITDTLRVGNGYSTNTHDGILLENGNHYLMIYDNQLVGMDTIVPGGNPNATVRGFVLQELDPDHNVIFQWRSWDHFNITDANNVDLTKATVDYVHINSFDTTADGNILLCCRHFDEITKIDRNTGEIIWRFGPKAQNNMFTFSNDTMGFSWPHDIQQLENGNLTLYDNGNFHVPKFSRGVEYQINEDNLTASLVWEYMHDPVFYCKNKGGTRRLPNSNTLIGWGNSWPIIATEASIDGVKTWELSVDSALSYRVMKFNWKTSFFETNFDEIDFGYWDNYVPVPIIFEVINNADHDITITSATNHLSSYYLGTILPMDIPAGGTSNLIVFFYPEGLGIQDFNDILTLNYDSYYADTLHQRIARQIVLKGTTIDPDGTGENQIKHISVQPNPTNDIVSLSSTSAKIAEIKIYNVIGSLMHDEKDIMMHEHRIDLSKYNSGIFFMKLRLINSNEPVIIKVVKN